MHICIYTESKYPQMVPIWLGYNPISLWIHATELESTAFVVSLVMGERERSFTGPKTRGAIAR